jgi:uncharacterized protein (DUF1697 family)
MKKESYVCLIRGINVGGHKIVKMDSLRKSLESLGFGGVKTYIQSGNVIFSAETQTHEKLCAKIQKKIQSDFGFDVSVMTRTANEIRKTIERNPFIKEKGIDTAKLHVAFLSAVPAKACLKALTELPIAPDAFHYSGREIYLYFPNGFSGAKLQHATIERVLACNATARNWNTVMKLHQMSSE